LAVLNACKGHVLLSYVVDLRTNLKRIYRSLKSRKKRLLQLHGSADTQDSPISLSRSHV
jgi:hypothetical protein